MMNIIDYDRRAGLTEEQRLQSLKESIQKALENIEERLAALEKANKN